MNVPSLTFFGFVFAVAIGYNAFSSLAWRQGVLVIANLLFLASFTTRVSAWIPYGCFLVAGYTSVCIVHKYRQRALFTAVMLLNILLFAWLKKYTFLPERSFLRFAFVVLGLSYVFFRILHLIIDTWQGTLETRIKIIDYFNYTLNFTCIISGPIQRYQEYAETQLRKDRPPLTVPTMAMAIERIIVGVFKVSILGLVLFELHKRAVETLPLGGTHTGFTGSITAATIIGIYPLFLYCNFSGYTDIVIGAAAFYRLKLPENFDRPFSSTNFLEFWSRWHMTLSNWLKMYVYIPLLKALMARVDAPAWQPYLGVFSFFVTFYLIGMWHGQTSSFAFYGVLLGLGVSLNKLYQIFLTNKMGKKSFRKLSENWTYNAVCRGLTFTYFSVSLAWFWSNWMQIRDIWHVLGGFQLAGGVVAVFFCSTVLLASWETMRKWFLAVQVGDTQLLTSRYLRTVFATAELVITVVLLEALSTPAPDIVYKAF